MSASDAAIERKTSTRASSTICGADGAPLCAELFDVILRDEVEVLLIKAAQEERHSGLTPRGTLAYRSGRVSRQMAAIEMLKGVEAIRNMLSSALSGKERDKLLDVFGSDCARIARTHAVL